MTTLILPDGAAQERLAQVNQEKAHLLGILFLLLEQSGGEVLIPPDRCATEREMPPGLLKWEFVPQPTGRPAMRVWWEPQ